MYRLKKTGLKLIGADGCITVFYIFKGRTWTPYGSCRDCGDYYEIALHSRYLHIDKKSMTVMTDIRNGKGQPDVYDQPTVYTAELVDLKDAA